MKPRARGEYEVAGVVRPNKTARGFTAAKERNQHQIKDALLSLYVRGTTDALMGLRFYTRSTQCKCCNSMTGPRVLTELGKRRLAAVRRIRYAREETDAPGR